MFRNSHRLMLDLRHRRRSIAPTSQPGRQTRVVQSGNDVYGLNAIRAARTDRSGTM